MLNRENHRIAETEKTMTKEKKPLFTNKMLLELLWPLIIEQFLLVLVGMIDTLMVAVAGEDAVSGVSLVDSVNILLIQVLAALTTGGCVVCSQYIGAQKEKEARHAAGQLLVITVLGASVISLIALAGNRRILSLIFGSVEPEVMNNAVIYFMYTAMSFPFLAVYNSCASLFRAMGNSKISMQSSVLMNGLNVMGNAICIFGFHMGVEGVAIPTLLSRMIAAVYIFYLIQKPRYILRISGKENLTPNRLLIRKILSVGIPNGLENGMFQFGKVILTSLIATLGTASIAGYTVANSIAMFMYLPGNALGIGLVTIAGQCIGAGEFHQAKQYTKKLILANYVLLAIICSIIWLGCKTVVSWYHLSSEAAVIGEYMIRLHAMMMLIWPIAFVSGSTLRASGDAKYTMVLAIITMWVFRVGMAYVFVRSFKTGVYGVWYAMALDWIVRNIALLLRFRGYEKRCTHLFARSST